MKIGIPKEIKVKENRISCTPNGAHALGKAGHQVFVEAGAYARTSTQALTNSTLPYVLHLANLGLEGAMRQIPELRPGLTTYEGKIVYSAVAEAFGLEADLNPFFE